MFSKKVNLIGVDIGSYRVKDIELKSKKDGYLLKNIAEMNLPEDVISEGTVVDYGEIVNVLTTIFNDNKFSHKKVAAALKGNAVIAKKLTVPSVDDKNFKETFRWEAEQYIQMEIDEVNIDYEILSQNKEYEQTEVLLAVARKDLIMDMTSVLESSKLKPVLIDLEVFSLLNAFEVNYGIDSDVSVIINIGHSSTLIIFVKNGLYEFSREINIGGKNAIEKIQQQMGMTMEESSLIIKDLEAIEYNDELQNVLKDFNKQLAIEIKNSVDMFSTTSQMDTLKCYLCGGGVSIFGLKDVILETLDVDVSYFNPFANIEFGKGLDSEFINANLYRFNIALGLALRKVDDK